MMKPDRVFADGRGGCDACRPASRVFPFQAAADANYLCAGCHVTRIHAPTAPQHEPVRDFGRAPAAGFQCRADAASTLSSPCDASFSSLNTMTRRHHQSNASASVDSRDDLGFLGVDMDEEPDEEEAAAWMLLDPAVSNGRQCNDGLLYSSEVDAYLNLGGYASYSENQLNLNDHYQSKQQTNGLISQQTSSCCGDGVIPVQTQPRSRFQSPITHTNVSLSSVDAGVATESEGSDGGAVAGQWRPAKGTMDLLSPGAQNPTAEAAAAVSLSGVEREARVLRYREKKKARRFEKTIRYASRKAYAESRPRIKGRFAKRASHADQTEQTFSPPAVADHSGYDWFISPGRD